MIETNAIEMIKVYLDIEENDLDTANIMRCTWDEHNRRWYCESNEGDIIPYTKKSLILESEDLYEKYSIEECQSCGYDFVTRCYTLDECKECSEDAMEIGGNSPEWNNEHDSDGDEIDANPDNFESCVHYDKNCNMVECDPREYCEFCNTNPLEYDSDTN